MEIERFNFADIMRSFLIVFNCCVIKAKFARKQAQKYIISDLKQVYFVRIFM